MITNEACPDGVHGGAVAKRQIVAAGPCEKVCDRRAPQQLPAMRGAGQPLKSRNLLNEAVDFLVSQTHHLVVSHGGAEARGDTFDGGAALGGGHDAHRDVSFES